MSAGDGDIIRGVMNMTMHNGDAAVGIFDYIIEKVSVGDWTDSALAAYVATAIQRVYGEVLTYLTDGMSFDTVDIYKRVGDIWDYLTTTTSSLTATDTGTDQPPGVALLLTAYTALNRVFGRKFIYGVTENGISGGLVVAGLLADMVSAASDYISAYNGGTMGPLDFLIPGVWSSKAVDFEPFSGVAVVKNILSYQRRRKGGVGV